MDMVVEGLNAIVSYNGNSSECHRCAHLRQNGATCAAFPRGIPEEILLGEVMHRKPIEGDLGFQYQRRTYEYNY